MRENRLEISIGCPTSKVFDFTVNPQNTHLWIDAVVSEETNQWPVRRGTIYRNVNSQGKWTEYEVSLIIQNIVFELKQVGGLYTVRYLYTPIRADDWAVQSPIKPHTSSILTYSEWMEQGELEAPFTLEPLEKLKSLLESKRYGP